jgi:iron(III) transport system substrate-binding protein
MKKVLVAGVAVLIILTGTVLFFFSGTGIPDKKEVVIYTSVDQVYAEPVFLEFTNRTGVRVLPVYDVEAAKTTGLVNRLIAEKDHPLADVFWSGEFAQTMLLKEKGVLAQYASPLAGDIPSRFRDPDGYWTGFGGRARILIVNTDRMVPADYPHSVMDLASGRYPADTIGIAYPMFGTASTQAAALYAQLGYDDARHYFTQLHDRGVRTVDGNSVVRDLVARGDLSFGITDTDDACGAVEHGDHVAVIVPDQQEGGMGVLIIPNTVAVIAGAPHPYEARLLADYLLGSDVEGSLVRSGWIQIPSRPVGGRVPCINASAISGMAVNYSAIYAALEPSKKDLAEIFIR